MDDEEDELAKKLQEILDSLAESLETGESRATFDTGRFILDENHQPVHVAGDLLEWARWMETDQHRLVKRESIGYYWISTIFLGLDHNHARLLYGDKAGPPLLFETMAFYQVPGCDDNHLQSERYATWDEAVAGHERIAADYRKAMNG